MLSTFGETIMVARRRRGWSQTVLGQQMTPACCRHTIMRWERGLTTPPAAQVARLARLLKLDAAALLHLLVSPATHGGQ